MSLGDLFPFAISLAAFAVGYYLAGRPDRAVRSRIVLQAKIDTYGQFLERLERAIQWYSRLPRKAIGEEAESYRSLVFAGGEDDSIHGLAARVSLLSREAGGIAKGAANAYERVQLATRSALESPDRNVPEDWATRELLGPLIHFSREFAEQARDEINPPRRSLLDRLRRRPRRRSISSDDSW